MNGNGVHHFEDIENKIEVSRRSIFLEELDQTVTKFNNKVFSRWFDENGKETNSYTFTALWEEAGYIAYKLRNDWNLKKGERIILCYNFGLQFYAAFLGCLRAGITAVLVYPPAPANLKKALPKLAKITSDSKAKFILVDSDVNLLRRISSLKSRKSWPRIEYKLHPTSKSLYKKLKSTKSFIEANISPKDIAFLQYTSGSTGDPKVSRCAF